VLANEARKRPTTLEARRDSAVTLAEDRALRTLQVEGTAPHASTSAPQADSRQGTAPSAITSAPHADRSIGAAPHTSNSAPYAGSLQVHRREGARETLQCLTQEAAM
jgi:hypothetical protein